MASKNAIIIAEHESPGAWLYKGDGECHTATVRFDDGTKVLAWSPASIGKGQRVIVDEQTHSDSVIADFRRYGVMVQGKCYIIVDRLMF